MGTANHVCQTTILHCTACCAVLCKLKLSLRCVLSGCTVTSRPPCRCVTSCRVREPQGSSLHVHSGQSPGMGSTLPGLGSLGSRAGSVFFAVASYTIPSSLGSTGQHGVFVWDKIWVESEGAILWWFSSSMTAASMLNIALSTPTSRSRCSLPWDGVRGVLLLAVSATVWES